jgi:hypothetical protein
MPREADEPSERSPLLDDRQNTANGHANGYATGDAEDQSAAAHHDGADEVVLAQEVSTKKLVAIIMAMFVGVFFAALGTVSQLQVGAKLSC